MKSAELKLFSLLPLVPKLDLNSKKNFEYLKEALLLRTAKVLERKLRDC